MMMKQQFSYPAADTRQTYPVATRAAASGRDMHKLSHKFQQMQKVQLLMQKSNQLQLQQQLQMVGGQVANRKSGKSKSQKRSLAGNEYNQASSASPSRVYPAQQYRMEPASAGRYMDKVQFEVSQNNSDSLGRLASRSFKQDTRKSASTDKRSTLKRKQTNSLRMSHQAPATGTRQGNDTLQNKQSNFYPAYSTSGGVDVGIGSRQQSQADQRSRSPMYRRNKQTLNNKTPESDRGNRRKYYQAPEYDEAASSVDLTPVRQVNPGSSCMDLEAQIQGKIKDLEHKYTKANQIGTSEYEMNIQDDQSEDNVAEDQVPSSNRKFNKERIQEIREATIEESSNQNSQSETANVGEVSQSTIRVIRNCEQMDQLLGAIPQVDQRPQNHNDQIQKDISNLIENFERVFVTYINENYRSFTERDLQRLIREELKQNLQAKLKELKLGQAYQNCDPFKIQSVLDNAAQLKATNEEMRESMHKVGVAVNQLAKTSFDLKNENFIDARMDKQIRDIAVSIDTLNHLFNDVHLKVLQNDNELNQIEITCSTTLSSHGHLRKFDELEKLHAKLDTQHKQLKQQLFDQTCEYKQLQNDYGALYQVNSANENESQKVRNMEQMLKEVRTDNREFIEKIEQLQAELFGKDRQIDKMRHQLKHGVIANGISPTFDHSYAGRGGTIASGTVQSKLELASDQAQLLSQAQNNQLRWRNSALALIRLTQRLFTSMKQLQRAMTMTKDQVDREKQAFEACKRELEQTMKSIKAEIDETELSVLKQGAGFMAPEPQGASNTMENIKTFKNMLSHQARSLSPQPKFKRTATIPKSSRECQTDFQDEAYRPTSAPSISHYKPQELIRLEVENTQLKSELETLKLYQDDLESNLQHMTECLKESKTAEFLLQQSALRQQKMAEEDALTFGDDNNQEEPAKKRRNKKKVDILDEFESDLLNVKQTIKETEELIKESKKNTFSQNEVKAGAPVKKRSYGKKEEEEVEDPKVEEERLVAKMNDLVKEKDQNILELTVERQRQDGVIEHLQAQVVGLEQEIEENSANIVAHVQVNRDNLELERARSECRYLTEKVETSQRAIERLEEQLKQQSSQQLEEVSASLASQMQNYNNLLQQLDDERHESTMQAREMQDLLAASAEKSELYVKLQTEFNGLCRAKAEQERQIHDLRDSIEKQRADAHERDNSQVDEALRNQLKHSEDEVQLSQEQNGQLQREISFLQLQHRDLQDQFDRSDKVHEREKLAITTQYQAEIMQITEKLQKNEKAEETRELKQAISDQSKQLDNYVSRDRDHVQQIETLNEEVTKLKATSNKEVVAPEKQEVGEAPATNQDSEIKGLREQLKRKDKEHLEHTDSLFEQHKEEISSLQEELNKLQAVNENQFGSNNSIRQLLQAKVDELHKENQQKSSKIEQVQQQMSQMDSLTMKLKESEAQILEQMQTHLRNEMTVKAKTKELERAEEALETAENEKQRLNQKLSEVGKNVRASEGNEQELNEKIERLKREKEALATEQREQAEVSKNELQLKQREIDLLRPQLDQKTRESIELESELGSMEGLKQKLKNSEAQIFEQMQAHLKNEMELKDKEKKVQSQTSTADQLKNKNTELQQKLEDLQKAVQQYKQEEVKQNFEVRQLESEKRTLKEHLQMSATKLQENHEANSKQMQDLRARLAVAELLATEAKTELDAVKEQYESLRKEKEEEAATKEDDFWSRPSRLDDSIEDEAKAGLNSEDHENLALLQEQVVLLQNQLDEGKETVLAKIKIEFQNQIDQINKAKTSFINEAILAKVEPFSAKKLQSDFSNDKIKEVGRIKADKEAYLIIQNHISLEERLTSKESEIVYLVKESNLDPAALSFLTSFVPSDKGLTMNDAWLEQFDTEIAKLRDECHGLRSESAALKSQILGLSELDDENEEIKALKDEQLRASTAAVVVKQQNNELQLKNAEDRKRIQELNFMLQNIIQTGNLHLESDSNQNEHQLSYGKNFNSLFGESSIKQRPSEASIVTVNDVDLSRGDNQDLSSGERTGDNAEVLEHLRSNLKMYLSKTPIIDSNNEIILQILFSMLNLTKQEITDLKETRAQLPVYKIDEKGTKKAQKQFKANEAQVVSAGSARTPSDPQATSEPLSAEAANLRHSLETATKTKFLAAVSGGLFGSKKSKAEVSEGSFGRADLSHGSIGAIEEQKGKSTSPAPFKTRKSTKDDQGADSY